MSQRHVVIVGAGSVGLVTALGLARAGARVTVLEREQFVSAKPRDTLYHWCILPVFAELGVLDELRGDAVIADRTTVLAPAVGERHEVDMSVLAGDTPHPYNMHVPQEHFTQVLLAALEPFADVSVRWGAEVTGLVEDSHGVTVHSCNDAGLTEDRADWVVGADGSRSVVRRHAGLALAGETWSVRFVSTDLHFDLSTVGHADASQRLDRADSAVIARVDRQGLWRYTRAESRMLDEEGVADRTADALERVLPPGAADSVVSTFAYRTHQRSATQFRRGRLILIGDAAHLTTPTMALGMLSGLFDSVTLVEALSAVCSLGADVSLLDRYSTARRSNFEAFTSPVSSRAMTEIFTGSQTRQDERIASFRLMASQPAAARRYLLEFRNCASPSLFSSADD